MRRTAKALLLCASLILVCSGLAAAQLNLTQFSFQSEDGSQLRLPVRPGTPSLLVLWNSRKVSHREALLRLEAVEPALRRRGLTIVAVEVSSARLSGARWLKSAGLPYHFAAEVPGAHSLSSAAGYDGEPVFLCADARATAVIIHRGFSGGDEFRIQSVCENLLR